MKRSKMNKSKKLTPNQTDNSRKVESTWLWKYIEHGETVYFDHVWVCMRLWWVSHGPMQNCDEQISNMKNMWTSSNKSHWMRKRYLFLFLWPMAFVLSGAAYLFLELLVLLMLVAIALFWFTFFGSLPLLASSCVAVGDILSICFHHIVMVRVRPQTHSSLALSRICSTVLLHFVSFHSNSITKWDRENKEKRSNELIGAVWVEFINDN